MGKVVDYRSAPRKPAGVNASVAAITGALR